MFQPKPIIFDTATTHETVWLTMCKTSRLMKTKKFLAFKSMWPFGFGVLFVCLFLKAIQTLIQLAPTHPDHC